MDLSDLSALTDDVGIEDIVLSLQHDTDEGLQTDFEYSYDNPIFFDNLDHKTKDLDFDEVGFAENIDVPEMNRTERTTLLKAINEKIENITGFTDEQCQRVKEVVIDDIHAFGTKDSPARMSKLVPIECELKHDSEFIAHPRWLGREQMEFLRKRL